MLEAEKTTAQVFGANEEDASEIKTNNRNFLNYQSSIESQNLER